MNEKKFGDASLLLMQLKAALDGDAECAALIEKLVHRTSILALGDIDPGRLAEEFSRLPAVKSLSLEQWQEMMLTCVRLMLEEQKKSIDARVKFTEATDTFNEYVNALELRCHELMEEFTSRGGDAAKYPPLEKP